jgi:hypothetical protein
LSFIGFPLGRSGSVKVRAVVFCNRRKTVCYFELWFGKLDHEKPSPLLMLSISKTNTNRLSRPTGT